MVTSGLCSVKMDFRNMKLPELRNFLKQRGIQHSTQRKENLIRLAEVANDLQFPVQEADDYKDLSVSRRTVTDRKTNKTVVLPDITTISVDKWKTDLKTLPSLEMGDIMVYLLGNCGWLNERLKQYKQDNGYLLYQCNHVSGLMLYEMDSYQYVKCFCVPETRQSADPYITWILLNDTGTVQSGGCTCVAYVYMHLQYKLII